MILKEIRSYFKTGELRSIEYRNEDNELHGDFISFHQNGKPNIITTLSNGAVVGRYRYFSRVGNLMWDEYQDIQRRRTEGETLNYFPND